MVFPTLVDFKFEWFSDMLVARKRTGFLVSVLFFHIVTCDNLDRTNPLDPQNPESQTKRIVLVDIFTNVSGDELAEASINAISRLSDEYKHDPFLLLEHHIEKTPGTDALAQSGSLIRYKQYVPDPSRQGLPHVFFDGLSSDIQGISDAETGYNRYLKELETRMTIPALFSIEANAKLTGDEFFLDGKIARLGTTSEFNVSVIAVITEDVFNNGRAIVRDIVQIETFTTFQSGHIKNVKKQIVLDDSWNPAKLSIGLVIQNSITLLVYQCGFVKF